MLVLLAAHYVLMHGYMSHMLHSRSILYETINYVTSCEASYCVRKVYLTQMRATLSHLFIRELAYN